MSQLPMLNDLREVDYRLHFHAGYMAARRRMEQAGRDAERRRAALVAAAAPEPAPSPKPEIVQIAPEPKPEPAPAHVEVSAATMARMRGVPLIAAHILREVSAETGVSVAQILSPLRAYPVVEARNWVMWWIREDSGLSTTAIGRVLNRDHTSVLHGLRRFRTLMDDHKVPNAWLARMQASWRGAVVDLPDPLSPGGAILQVVADVTGCDVAMIIGKRRSVPLDLVRPFACYWLHRCPDLVIDDIAKLMRRDLVTVSYNIARFEVLRDAGKIPAAWLDRMEGDGNQRGHE